jgi:hypothetical protein
MPVQRALRGIHAFAVLVSVAALLVLAAPASALRLGAFTEINPTADGLGVGPSGGLCHNRWTSLFCNQFYAERFVWTTAGESGNTLPDGNYFFSVHIPSLTTNPNDAVPARNDRNLSDDHDSYRNRTFTAKGGKIYSYTPLAGATPHDLSLDSLGGGQKKLRLHPFSPTTSSGGVYVLAVCPLVKNSSGAVVYPVSRNSCWYDAFKVHRDYDPPTCPRPTFGVNASRQKTATQLFSDPGGIDTVEIVKYPNVAVAPLQPGVNWFQGTTSEIELTATKVDQSQPSTVEIIVKDVAGNTSRCDPVLTTVRRGLVQTHRVTGAEDFVSIQNGRPGLKRLVVTVNGRHFAVRALKPGQRVKLHIGSALRRGKGNVVRLRGFGGPGGQASLMISN